MIRRTRFVFPYVKTTTSTEKIRYRANIPGLKRGARQSGVYAIRSTATNKIIYVGSSSEAGGQLYKTIYRHFQIWNDPEQDRAVYDRHKHQVKVIYCTPRQALLLEKYFIQRLKPRDNHLKYGGHIFSKAEKEEAKEIIYTANETAPEEAPF